MKKQLFSHIELICLTAIIITSIVCKADPLNTIILMLLVMSLIELFE